MTDWQASPHTEHEELTRGPWNWLHAPWPTFYSPVEQLCFSRSPGGYHCSRFLGHSGRHAAYLIKGPDTRVTAVWS